MRFGAHARKTMKTTKTPTPVRDTWLPYSQQWIEEDDLEAVKETLVSSWLTQGPQVSAFEEEFAHYVGAAHAVSFASGTSALVAAHRAAKVGPGDLTLTSPMTFAATANAALLAGGTPCFVDISPDTGLMDSKLLADKISPAVKAVVPVHYAGSVCDMEQIVKIAHAGNALVIEDACHGLGATLHQKKAGTLADMSVFSFHPVKPITTGEGGMVTTNDPELAATLKSLATHGIVKDKKCADVGPWYYEVRSLSDNGRLSDIHCALGRTQLKKADRLLRLRREKAEWYDRQLAADDIFCPLTIPKGCDSAYHLYPVLVEMSRLTLSKKELVEIFHAMNIGVQVHYIPVHMHPLYRNLGIDGHDLPCAESFYEKVISLPLFPAMMMQDQQDVLTALSTIKNSHLKG